MSFPHPARIADAHTTATRRSAVVAATTLGMVGLTACFTTAADFQGDAETFILENEELSTVLETEFTEATCAEPQSQAVGTTFDCDAVDAEGRPWEFQIVITATDEYEVNVSRRPSEF